MSVHDPMSRKRDLPQECSDVKRARTEHDHDQFSDKVYSLFVKSALESLEMDPLKLNSLTTKISLPLAHREAISLPHFIIVLKSLVVNVSKLDNAAARSLIGAILRFQWLELSETVKKSPEFPMFLATYAHFVGALVSSFPKYLQDVLKKLVQEFPRVSDDTYPHHEMLSKFVSYFPTCINTIPQIMLSNLPHHLSASTSDIVNYVANLMKMISYCPDLQFSIWQMVVEITIKMDVELQNELDDLDDDCIEDLINEDDEEIDDANDDDPNDMSLDNDEETELVAVASTQNIKRLVSKLDTTLSLLLKATASSFTAEELNSGNGVPLFNTLTSLFKTHILPTHFTKSIQFLLFHITQYQPELADSYLVLLIDFAFNPNEITEKRLKALQYLASYISRAKNLTKHQVVFIVSYLIGWINKYIAEREHEVLSSSKSGSGTSSSGGMERFKLFYATFQALLYIFCFRHNELSKMPDEISAGDSEWECDIDKFFQRAIIVKFNPLKYCDETVVFIFAKIATKLNVCYCYSIIENNKRERMIQTNSNLPSSVGNFRHKQEFLDLEAYFPFDPMVLPVCKKIVSANYVEWRDVNPNTDDDDDVDSGSHGEDDDEDEDEDDDDDDDEDEEEDEDEDDDDEDGDED